MRTTPALISAAQRPTAAQLYTYKAAIEELQTKIDWTCTWTIETPCEVLSLENLPSDLATLTMLFTAESTHETPHKQPAITGWINGVKTAGTYPMMYTYWDENGTFFQESRSSDTSMYFGRCKGAMSGSTWTASELTFPNWGIGSGPLTYTGTTNGHHENGFLGGYALVTRPITTIQLFVDPGNWVAGSTFTLVGRYP